MSDRWLRKLAASAIDPLLQTVNTGIKTYRRTNRVGTIYLRDHEEENRTEAQKKVHLELMKARLSQGSESKAG